MLNVYIWTRMSQHNTMQAKIATYSIFHMKTTETIYTILYFLSHIFVV